MQPSLTEKNEIEFIIGDSDSLDGAINTNVLCAFDNSVINFLNELSKMILGDKESKKYSDVISFAFWIRRSSIEHYKQQYKSSEGLFRLGKGIVFHIAPSNVAVNYAYSLVSGLLTGNINIVRIPSKQYKQIDLINNAIKKSLVNYPELKQYIILIKYGHNNNINDYLSSICDVRVIWGGDETVKLIRKSELKPRTTEVVFADRYSISLIDSDYYLNNNIKDNLVEGFYNDTYFSDQNACSSPKIIIWFGNSISISKQDFWTRVSKLVSEKYNFQSIQSVDKYALLCKVSCIIDDLKYVKMNNNLITRILVDKIDENIINCFGNSGFFFEYDACCIDDIAPLFNNNKCQTVTYIGDKKMIQQYITNGYRGVDRIVPFGSSMDFDLIWDGYDLVSSLSRIISIR